MAGARERSSSARQTTVSAMNRSGSSGASTLSWSITKTTGNPLEMTMPPNVNRAAACSIGTRGDAQARMAANVRLMGTSQHTR
jgi:hypothetical protein